MHPGHTILDQFQLWWPISTCFGNLACTVRLTVHTCQNKLLDCWLQLFPVIDSNKLTILSPQVIEWKREATDQHCWSRHALKAESNSQASATYQVHSLPTALGGQAGNILKVARGSTNLLQSRNQFLDVLAFMQPCDMLK